MTEPTPTETPPPGFKACGCGVLIGESCDCGEFAASATAALASPLLFAVENGTYGWVRPASPDAASEVTP